MKHSTTYYIIEMSAEVCAQLAWELGARSPWGDKDIDEEDKKYLQECLGREPNQYEKDMFHDIFSKTLDNICSAGLTTKIEEAGCL